MKCWVITVETGIQGKMQPKILVPMLTGPRSKRWFVLVPSYDAEIYPMAFCVSTAVVLGVYYSLRHALLNPDISLTPRRRETPTWERCSPEDGKLFRRNRFFLANLCSNAVNTLPGDGK